MPVFLGLDRFGADDAFTIPGCMLRLTVSWSVTAQSSPVWRKRGAGMLGASVGVFMVITWFFMRFCPWRLRSQMLYLCTCCTVGFPFAFFCASGEILFMWGAHWVGRLCGSTLGGVEGAASGVFTLRDGVGVLCVYSTTFGGVGSCGVVDMLKF